MPASHEPGERRRGRPHPAVAAIRLAVRKVLTQQLSAEAGLAPGALVVAACSGGPDSLALAAALGFEAPRLGLRAGGVTVDHGLQEGSAAQACRVKAALGELGLDPVRLVSVDVRPRATGPGYAGPEAAARHARYAAFEAVAAELAASSIALGHTMDDQAETVVLGLARGSGARSLAGMSPVAGLYLRPLLGLRRAQTVAACGALGLDAWHDPANTDDAYRRTRVRRQILPLMEELIGPGVTESLARTAEQLRADADALDELAGTKARPLLALWPPAGQPGPRSVAVTDLADLAVAVRTRLLKRAAIGAGAPAGALTSAHIAELDALITGWRGQRWLDLPGGIRCQRRYGRLHFTATEPQRDRPQED